MKVKITPKQLAGVVQVPSSKSVGHREIICAALTQGSTVVDNVTLSQDIEATNRCMAQLGVRVEPVASLIAGRSAFRYVHAGALGAEVDGAQADGAANAVCAGAKGPAKSSALLDCGESGSTLRFLIPLAATLGRAATFTGRGKLPVRPLDPYFELFDQHGVRYDKPALENLPLVVTGNLHAGEFELVGNVSSQFVSGMLFVMPLLRGDSRLLVRAPIESYSYISLTLGVLRDYGIAVQERWLENGDLEYCVPGNQAYRPAHGLRMVEGDWSQAAFWLVAGTLAGPLTLAGLNQDSLQGDKVVLDLVRRMGGNVATSAKAAAVTELHVQGAATHATVMDAADCPDLVPVMTVLAALSEGTTHIVHAGRLRVKECDRLAAISTELRKLGAHITEEPEGLRIEGRPEGLEGGCEVDAWNDHRIAMSLAVAACRCKQPITLTGAEAVRKSYPDFWQVYAQAGGDVKVLEP